MTSAHLHRPLIEYQLPQHGRLVSVTRPAHGITPASFLRRALGRERVFWHDGRSGFTFAGMGAAADLMGWGETRLVSLERQARQLFEHAVLPTEGGELAKPRLFGGMAFRDDFVPDNTWTGFNPAHFVLPHVQLACHGGACWITLNTLVPVEDDPADTLPQLDAALDAWVAELSTPQPDAAPDTRPPTAEVRYPMEFPEWERIICAAIDRFHHTPLQKVVLARVCEVRMDRLANVDVALANLLARYPECYVFLFEPRPHHAFFGATPELLAHVEGVRLTSMGLAGSIQRGATPEEDAALAAELLASAKDRHEHALVLAAMERRLRPLAAALDIPETPEVYTLSNIQHLYTPVTASLHEARGILPLLEVLHPTPALGGTPRGLALEFIREAEPVPRGWYAAPVGWIDHRLDGAFGVAIRSAVADNRRVWLYAGAGIVADSQPEKEWVETGWKFRPIQDALGVKREG
jgi:menaquinone-specific isochorismate synthase